MPREKNPLLRAVVPIIAFAAAIGVAAAFFAGGGPGGGGQPAQQTQRQEDEAPTEDEQDQSEDQPEDQPPAGAAEEGQEQAATPPQTEPDSAEPSVEVEPIEGLRARSIGDPADSFAPVGGVGEDSEYALRLEFTPTGAGIEAITLARHYLTPKNEKNYAVQEKRSAPGGSDGRTVSVASLAARAVAINGDWVDLYSSAQGRIWRQRSPGQFEAVLENGVGEAVARIEKRYELTPGGYDLKVHQRLVNLTDKPMRIRWVQYGPVDLPPDATGYGGPKRRVRFGYLLDPQQDPSQSIVESGDILMARGSALDRAAGEGLLWPSEQTESNNWKLVWSALTNRYFAFSVHPLIGALSAGSSVDKRFHLVDRVHAVALDAGAERALTLQLTSPQRTAEPGEALDLSFGAYAGPKWRKTLTAEPTLDALGMDELVVFNFGGPCAFCTFQPLARALHWFLGFVHDYLVRDWAMAILLLVVCVRGVLHPVTKRSQIRMQRFSKQMQSLAPKQQKIKEKYPDDPKRQQQEMAKLMKEEGINPAQALGCLPLFLQSPIWIALYAMLYFAFDLRHDAAFYGFFQTLSGGAWTFLGDLSSPDSFLDFGQALVTIPLLGPISSINVLPLVLGVVFFLQQKYMTPQTAAATPEQQTQQRVMRVMMVVMFPVIIYNAPSGLALYFVTNSTLGILEGRYIRSHMEKLDEREQREPKPAKKKTKKVGAGGPGAPQAGKKTVHSAQRPKQRRKKKKK